MSHKEYLTYLREQKRLIADVRSRYPLDTSSPYYQLQSAHDKLYNDYIDRQIEQEELKAMEEMVSSYLKNMSIDVSLDGEKISDAIVREITKGFKK